MRRLFLLLALLAFAPTAWAQTFPAYNDSGVIDAANLLDPAQEQALSQKLIAQKQASGRAIVVATVPDLQGYDISDFGYRLGRAWGIGDKAKNDGALLIVAPAERKLRIEVGYGLEGILTDALSSQIIRNAITPRFKAGDMPGGINAGVDEISALLALPPEEAKAQAAAAASASKSTSDDGAVVAIWITLFIIFFVLMPLFSRLRGGRRYRGGSGPVIIWGSGSDSGWGSGGGSSWGGGGGGGGGFSGGGSFGGGGASGGW
ncbi:MAG: TPM domain-containing protein [Sphingobium sp.]